MSFLSELLGVPEEVAFKIEGNCRIYKIVGEERKCCQDVPFGRTWFTVNNELSLLYMIKHKDKIKTTLMLTEKQKIAIKGRIAEGTPWAAKDKKNFSRTWFYSDKPIEDDGVFNCIEEGSRQTICASDLYSFVSYENSPIYLPDLIEEE